MEYLGLLFCVIVSSAPLLCILFVTKGKKIWLFNLITILATAALITYDFFVSYNAEDFHTAAFILQLFLPIQVVSAILALIVGNIILLNKKGYFTKKRLKNISIMLLALAVFIGFGSFVRRFITVTNYKELPDITYTAVNLQYHDDGYGVIYCGAENSYKEVQLDDTLVSLLQKNEYASEYEECFAGTPYEEYHVRRALVDENSKKVYMITGSKGGDSYYKLFCYDKDSNSLNLIVDGDSWIYDFDLSDDGSYLVYEISDKLIKIDLSSNESTVIKDNIKQKDKTAADEKLVRISKDGKYIMYYYGSDAPVPFQKYIYVYNVEKDMIQKVAIKLTQGFYNANWYEE
ncbi:hypothetical protein [Butyrivibrio proteoclasticus]|uniref:hypothetical protein n=1 Tax=Butyrivibrio proteoclasticus TaxID=43305 RepID=UPI00047971F0|nr:hypothetical protein [Butyrivibrio proteoclasticus]